MPCLLYLKILLSLVAYHHRNYACYHLPTRGRAGIKLGDVHTSQTYLYFLLAPCIFFVTLSWFRYTFDHIWTNLLNQCTQVPVPVFCSFLFQVFPKLKVPNKSRKKLYKK